MRYHVLVCVKLIQVFLNIHLGNGEDRKYEENLGKSWFWSWLGCYIKELCENKEEYSRQRYREVLD